MSRSSIIDALIADNHLKSLGIEEDCILQGQGVDERPSGTNPFILINWGTEPRPAFGNVKSPRRVTIWAHIPWEVTNDMSKVDCILDGIENCLQNLEHAAGTDGFTVTCVRVLGRSQDMKDEELHTFCRWVTCEVLSRKDS